MTSPITDAIWLAAREAYHQSWYGNPSVDKALRAALKAALPSALAAAEARTPVTVKALDEWFTAHDAYHKASAAYNERLAAVRAERERGNWLMNVNTEYDVLNSAQSNALRADEALYHDELRIRALRPPSYAKASESEQVAAELVGIANEPAGEPTGCKLCDEGWPVAYQDGYPFHPQGMAGSAPCTAKTEPAGAPSEENVVICQRCGEPITDERDRVSNYGEDGYNVHRYCVPS